jgi:hypothetical protein
MLNAQGPMLNDHAQCSMAMLNGKRARSMPRDKAPTRAHRHLELPPAIEHGALGIEH